MPTHKITFLVEGLNDLDAELLAQSVAEVGGDSVTVELERPEEEENDAFRERASRWISLELSRLNVLTGRLHKSEITQVDPNPPGGTTVYVGSVWHHLEQKPPEHLGWDDPSASFRLSAWDVASHTEDFALGLVMLDSICESAGIDQAWVDRSKPPPRFVEVRLLRNLLVHGAAIPSQTVRDYLTLLIRPVPEDRNQGRVQHLNLARFRFPHLKAAVWRIVYNDCVENKLDLLAAQPAGHRGILVEDHGTYPVRRVALGGE